MSFPNSQNVFHGTQFTDINITKNVNGPTGIDILLEASYPEAAHDAADREYSPRCHPGTREQYIEDVVGWAVPALGGTPTPIYWMKGPAGVGKSAIAQTCAENLKDTGHLGAAFFFSIGGQEKPEKFFPSIAYQLSTVHPPYHDLLEKRVRSDRTLVKKTMLFQFRYLIDKPLRELASQGKGIRQRIAVIIDGLDECKVRDAQSEIIRIIASSISDNALPLCWAFFSRPEPQIEAAFAGATVAPHCHKTTLTFSRDDDGEIELYLKNGFENVLRWRNISMSSRWPSAEDIETLVDAADGSFIYAMTVVRYIDHHGLLGYQERLSAIIDTILNRRNNNAQAGTSNDAPFATLDAFYRLILQRIPEDISPSVHLLLALICYRGISGAILAANLLGLSKGEFETICNHACAVILVEDPGKGLELGPIIDTSRAFMQANISPGLLREIDHSVSDELGGKVSFYHKSFSDFLLDPARSGRYCVKGFEVLGKQIHKMHLDYDPTYCWEGSELVLAPGVTDSAASLSYLYPNELVNSVIKALVYTCVGLEDWESFSALGAYGVFNIEIDFRKWLHIVRYLYSEPGSLPDQSWIWGCRCRYKHYAGTVLDWISLADFDVNEFKMMVKKREEAGIIQLYRPNVTSQVLPQLFPAQRKPFESAVYLQGRDEKSIFWYWEINYERGHFRYFRTNDLAEGEKRFREENFALWPDLYSEDDPDL